MDITKLKNNIAADIEEELGFGDHEFFVASPMFASFKILGVDNKEFLQKFEGLPSTVKGFLCSEDIARKIYETGTRYNLRDRQIQSAASCVRDLFTGGLFLKNLIHCVGEKTKVPQESLNDFVHSLINDVLGSVHDDLIKIQKADFAETLSKPEPKIERAAYSQPQPPQIKPLPPEKPKTIPNPGANIDLSQHNVLNLRNKNS